MKAEVVASQSQDAESEQMMSLKSTLFAQVSSLSTANKTRLARKLPTAAMLASVCLRIDLSYLTVCSLSLSSKMHAVITTALRNAGTSASGLLEDLLELLNSLLSVLGKQDTLCQEVANCCNAQELQYYLHFIEQQHASSSYHPHS